MPFPVSGHLLDSLIEAVFLLTSPAIVQSHSGIFQWVHVFMFGHVTTKQVRHNLKIVMVRTRSDSSNILPISSNLKICCMVGFSVGKQRWSYETAMRYVFDALNDRISPKISIYLCGQIVN